jgi:hypothetical protein
MVTGASGCGAKRVCWAFIGVIKVQAEEALLKRLKRGTGVE